MAAGNRHVTGTGSGELTSLTISTGQRDQKWLESSNAQSLSLVAYFLQLGHTSEASYIALPTGDRVVKYLRLWGTSQLNAQT